MITDLIAELKAAEEKHRKNGSDLLMFAVVFGRAIRPLLEHVEAQRRQLEIAESLLSGYGKREYARLAAMASEGEGK